MSRREVSQERKIVLVEKEGSRVMTQEQIQEYQEFIADLCFEAWRKDFEAGQSAKVALRGRL